MADKIRIKRSSVQDKVPLTTDVELGELAMNTNDGKLFMKQDDGAEAIVQIGKDVVDDTSPQLGAPLETLDNNILITDGAGVINGAIGNSVDGVAIAYTGADGSYSETDGAIVLKPSGNELHGTTTSVISLKGTEGRQVYCSPEGTLYSITAPVPGWSETDTDNGDYPLTILGNWVEITGLVITVPEDVIENDRIDIVTNLHIINESGKSGYVAVGWGINGVEPSSSGVASRIDVGFDNIVPINISSSVHSGLTTGDTITVWAKISIEEHTAFDPEIHGSSGGTHELTISIPNTGGSETAIWGSISGTLSDQSDLQTALNLKANDSDLTVTNNNVTTLQTDKLDVTTYDTRVLNDISNVNLTAQTLNDTLEFNGSVWINTPAGLKAVEDDLNPILGGNLATKGNNILISKTDESFIGGVGELYDGVGIGYSTTGTFLETDGAYAATQNKSTIYGTITEVKSLTGTGNRQVFTTANGQVYAVEPPEPGWSETDTDNTDYALPTLGLWVELPGLAITVPEDVTDGDLINAVANINVVNNSSNRAGQIQSYFSANHITPPDIGVITDIGPGFNGIVPIIIQTGAHGGLTTGDTVSVWVKRYTQEHNAFDPNLIGSTGTAHELTLSTPSTAGATGTKWGQITGVLDDQVDLLARLNSKIGAVSDDQAPVLSADLKVGQRKLNFHDTGDSLVGAIATNNDDDGIKMFHSLTGVYNPDDGAIVVKPGSVEMRGAVAHIDTLQSTANRQVYADADGNLYGVVPPDPGWSVSDTDTGVYSMPTLGTWVEMTDLVVTMPEDTSADSRIDITTLIHIINNGDVEGTVDISFGVNNAEPLTPGVSFNIGIGFNNVIPVSLSTSSHNATSAGDTLGVWVKRSTEVDGTFDPVADGSTNDHELTVSTPSDVGATASWGSIAGTLSDQTDLQAELDNKISQVQDDTTPVLGGTLDVNDFHLTESNTSRTIYADRDFFIQDVGSLNASSNVVVQTPHATATSNVILKDQAGNNKFIFQYDEFIDTAKIVNNTGNPLKIDQLFWPTTDGTDGQVMTTDGSGNLSFSSVSGSGGMNDLVDDTTPQLGGNLDTNGFSIGYDLDTFTPIEFTNPVLVDKQVFIKGTTANLLYKDSLDNLKIQMYYQESSDTFQIANGTANPLKIDNLNWPQNDGTANQVMTTDGNGNLSFSTASGGMSDLIDDTSPQLGGNLDTNGKTFVNTASGDSTTALDVQGRTGADSWISITNGSDSTTSIYDAPEIKSNGVSGDIIVKLPTFDNTFYVDGQIGIHGDSYITNCDREKLLHLWSGEPFTNVNHLGVFTGSPGFGPQLKAEGTDTDINLDIVPKGLGKVRLSNIKYPNADGNNGQYLMTDGNGNLSFASISGGGDFTGDLAGNILTDTVNNSVNIGKDTYVRADDGKTEFRIKADAVAGTAAKAQMNFDNSSGSDKFRLRYDELNGFDDKVSFRIRANNFSIDNDVVDSDIKFTTKGTGLVTLNGANIGNAGYSYSTDDIYNLALSDMGNIIEFTSGNPVTIILPDPFTDEIPSGASVQFIQGTSTGPITIDDSHPNIAQVKTPGSLSSNGIYTSIFLLRTEIDIWLLYGDVAP